MSGATFLCCFTRQMVPKRFRRIRYFGLLAGAAGRHRALPGAPVESLSEKAPKAAPRPAAEGRNRFSLCPPMNAPPLVQPRGKC